MKKAQGTIEYLVILSVIIIIGLLVVGLLSNMFSTTPNISITSKKVGLKTGAIQITNLSQSTDGNLYLELSSNDPDGLTVTNVKVNDSNQDFNTNNQIFLSSEKLFSIPLTTCTEGETTTQIIIITYQTPNGLTKTETKETTLICENTNINQNTSQAGQGTNTLEIEDERDATEPEIKINSVDTNRNNLNIYFTASDNNEIKQFDINYTGNPNFSTITPTSIDTNDYNYQISGLNYGTTYNICLKATDYNDNIKITCNTVTTQAESEIYFESTFNIQDNPIQISNCHDLNNIRTKLDGNYILQNDINMLLDECSDFQTGNGFEPIASSGTFTGILNGNENKIYNLMSNYPTNTGGFIKNFNGKITKLGLENINYSTYNYTGGLVNLATGGIINEVYVKGTISTELSAPGGLIGQNNTETGYLDINNSYTNLIYSGDYGYSGGLIGDNSYNNQNKGYAKIYNSFAISLGSGGIMPSGIFGNGNDNPELHNVFFSAYGMCGFAKEGSHFLTYNTFSTNDCILSYPPQTIEDCTSNQPISSFYDSSHPVYTGTPAWDFVNIWQANDNNLPTFKWE